MRSAAGMSACAALGGLVANAIGADPIPLGLLDVLLLSAVVTTLVAMDDERVSSVRREAMRARANKRLISSAERAS